MTQLANTIIDDVLEYIRGRIPTDMAPHELYDIYTGLIEMLSQDQSVVNEIIQARRTYKREEALYNYANRVYDTDRDYDQEEFS